MHVMTRLDKAMKSAWKESDGRNAKILFRWKLLNLVAASTGIKTRRKMPILLQKSSGYRRQQPLPLLMVIEASKMANRLPTGDRAMKSTHKCFQSGSGSELRISRSSSKVRSTAQPGWILSEGHNLRERYSKLLCRVCSIFYL